MFVYIRKHASFVNVVAVIALVFVMTGGALAAKKYLITSTKQISPQALADLKSKAKGANGAVGPQGAAGPQGPAGSQGPAGNNGSNGSNGANGADGKAGGTGPRGTTGTNGTNGTTGATGPTGQTGYIETLPPGKTETGTWAISAYAPEAGQEFYSNISFNIPLKAPGVGEEVHILKEKASPTTACPGSAVKPEAQAGNLCVYTIEEENEHLGFFGKSGEAATVAGVPLAARTNASGGQIKMIGTWAVTAP